MRMPPPENVMIYTGTELIIIPDITSPRGAMSFTMLILMLSTLPLRLSGMVFCMSQSIGTSINEMAIPNITIILI